MATGDTGSGERAVRLPDNTRTTSTYVLNVNSVLRDMGINVPSSHRVVTEKSIVVSEDGESMTVTIIETRTS